VVQFGYHLQQTFVSHVSDLEQAILKSVEEQNDPEIAIVPEGPYVVPRYTGPELS